MKRDLELVRDILFAVERSDKVPLGWLQFTDLPARPKEEISYHVELMCEAGLIEAQDLSSSDGYAVLPKRLTWEGHEFLDSIRDPEIWRKTKEGASKVGGASVQFVWEIAKAYAKQLIKDRLGISLDGS